MTELHVNHKQTTNNTQHKHIHHCLVSQMCGQQDYTTSSIHTHQKNKKKMHGGVRIQPHLRILQRQQSGMCRRERCITSLLITIICGDMMYKVMCY